MKPLKQRLKLWEISEILGNKYCKECILSKSKNHILVRNETIRINQSYAPEKIKLLFVAESPPMAFLEDRSKYFYASGQVKRRGLFYHMMSVLFKEEMKEYPKYTKEYFLKRFKGKRGFYLIDMVKCPINKLPKKEKRKAIESCSKYLNKELNSLDFQKVIFIGKGTFKKIKKYLNLDFDYAVIPFPRYSKNVQNFRTELTTFCKLGCQIENQSKTEVDIGGNRGRY